MAAWCFFLVTACSHALAVVDFVLLCFNLLFTPLSSCIIIILYGLALSHGDPFPAFQLYVACNIEKLGFWEWAWEQDYT